MPFAFYWCRMHHLSLPNLDESIFPLCPGSLFTLEMSKHVFKCMGVLFRISILYFLLTWHMEEEMQKPCYASCLFSGLST